MTTATLPKRTLPLETEVLDSLVGRHVQVYLTNGVSLRGVLRAHDEKNLILDGRKPDDPPSLIYKQQLSTIHELR